MKFKITHGMSLTKTYRAWVGMKQRCENTKNRRYQAYGGRGIVVCKEWATFEGFYDDMGEKPEGKSLDRINNDSGYSIENCRWATAIQQQNNTRTNKHIEYNGIKKTVSQWSRYLGINKSTLSKRLRRGWGTEEAFMRDINIKGAWRERKYDY